MTSAANPIKGEFPLKAADVDHTLVLDANALCVAEGMTGKTASEMVALATNGNFTVLRALLWCGLQRHHDDMTLEDAGDLITEIGPGQMQIILVNGIANTFPKVEAGKPRPRARKVKTA